MAKSTKSTALDEDLVRKLAGLLEETGLTEIEYGADGWHLRVAKNAPQLATLASIPAAQGPVEAKEATGEADASAHPGVIVSPMVGMVYTSPDPEMPPFVKVGDQVSEGDTLLLIEAMKVFNPIKAPRAGKVTRILIDTGTPVEFGEPLLIIE